MQQLEKGGEYEIIIKSRDSKGIFNVHINRVDNTESTLANTYNSGNLFTPWYSRSSLQYTSVFQRNMGIGEVAHGNSLLSTVMTNNMPFNGNISFNSWFVNLLQKYIMQLGNKTN
ncbi:unnamed protein product [Onchocerca ochengi]|uniref:Plastocyanin-like domain-containing protein n=1 Tax=Onchocerca ochengi TaxID=42157 RepID=A0A182EXJ2_ONCOC|nr:unnamed protein product [Onchocerca ochengi]